MEEQIKQQIKTGIGLWIISWLGTVILIIAFNARPHNPSEFPSVLILCDILFPIIVISLKNRLKKYNE